MKKMFAVLFVLAMMAPLQSEAAITGPQARSDAVSWIVARSDAILNRVETCITENPRLCHTAWAASVTPNTDPSDNALATVTLDDPGRPDQCGLFDGRGSFANAGIVIPATAPLNSRITIMKNAQGWGVLLEIEIKYDGVVYRRGFARGIAVAYGWEVVEEI